MGLFNGVRDALRGANEQRQFNRERVSFESDLLVGEVPMYGEEGMVAAWFIPGGITDSGSCAFVHYVRSDRSEAIRETLSRSEYVASVEFLREISPNYESLLVEVADEWVELAEAVGEIEEVRFAMDDRLDPCFAELENTLLAYVDGLLELDGVARSVPSDDEEDPFDLSVYLLEDVATVDDVFDAAESSFLIDSDMTTVPDHDILQIDLQFDPIVGMHVDTRPGLYDRDNREVRVELASRLRRAMGA